MEWMRDGPCNGHQLLVLTDEAPQGAVDLAVHALQTLPEVAGPCVQWRVELLAG
jgi:homoserine dehydrogenase